MQQPQSLQESWHSNRKSQPLQIFTAASLLSTLCARLDPCQSIPQHFVQLIQTVVVACPQAVVPDSLWTWTHPMNFLCRGDPLFTQCRDVMLKDIRWSPDIHPLLPREVQLCYVLLARIPWKHEVTEEGEILRCIASFLPPVVTNQRSKAVSCRTVLEEWSLHQPSLLGESHP